MSRSRLGAAVTAAAFLAPLVLFLIRFSAFLRGGVVAFRDAGFFFVPWRVLLSRQLASGVFPSWNDALSAGRPFAADPNAALFWPGTPLLAWLSPTALTLGNAALAVLLCVLAARLAGLSPLASGAAGTVLLFSGVFQTLPLLFTSICSAAPLPIALVAARRLARGDGRPRRLVAAIALSLGLSALGGEPAIAAIAGAGALIVLLFAGGARRAPALAAAGALAVGIAAVQVLPAAALLSRAARGHSPQAAAAALTFSVRPGRLLTLLEPRLVGDPFAESDADYWGAAAFDAGNPYFYDIALGLVPLLLALAAAADTRARPFLGTAAAAAFLSFGRFVPGLGEILARLAIFRFPEKWWVLVTVALVLAAAIGVDAVRMKDEAVLRALRNASGAAAALLGALALVAILAPAGLRGMLFGAGLGGGPAPAARIAGLLLPRLSAAALAAVVVALLARACLGARPSNGAARVPSAAGSDARRSGDGDAVASSSRDNDADGPAPPEPSGRKAVAGELRVAPSSGESQLHPPRRALISPRKRHARGPRHYSDGLLAGRLTPGPVLAALGVLFFADAAARVAGTLPAERPDLYTRAPDEVRVVLAAQGEGRFYDDGADRKATALARAGRAGGIDLLRPATGAVFGLRYAGENDVDRMTSRASFEFARRLAALPWGAEKTDLLRLAGVTVARTDDPGPDPPGVRFLARFEADRIVAVEGSRPELSLVPPGRISLVRSAPNRQTIDADVPPGGSRLEIARTFDPLWRASVDGRAGELLSGEGPFASLELAPGRHRVVLTFFDPLFVWGGVASLLALAAALALARR